MPYLIYSPNTPNQVVYNLQIGVNTIGRLPSNQVVLMYDNISRVHAEIVVTENTAVIKDLKSSNKTFLNDQELDQIPKTLKEGDHVRFASINFQFVYTRPEENQNKEPEEQQVSIVKQIPVQQNNSDLLGLVGKNKKDRSVIKLQHQDAETRALDKLRILLEVSKQLCSPDEPQQLLEKILDLIFTIMDIDRAVILLSNDESKQLEMKAVKLKEGIPPNLRFYSQRITNLVYEQGNALLITDAFNDNRLIHSYSIVQGHIHASMCVPLKTNLGIIGVLYVDNLSLRDVYSEEDLEFLTGLANQAAFAIQMACEFYKREQELKQKLVQLQIQIDEKKKEQELAEITGSDYFQELEKKAARLRNLDNLE